MVRNKIVRGSVLHCNLKIIYNTLFDKRKIVEIHEPQYVVRTLSEITDYFASTFMNDLDALFAEEQYQLNGVSDNEI